jgi:hypothetical protein
MARWFRSHVAKLDSHKVQLLPDAHYRAWDSLLCVAALHDGVLPPLSETAFRLRKSCEATAELIDVLVAAGLFDRTERGIVPHDWDDWQYTASVSTERVKRFRQRTRNTPATPPESETDSESEADASGAGAPETANADVKAMFDEGVKLLGESGCSERNARTLVGKWRRDSGGEATLAALRAARAEAITEPIAWITARLASQQRQTRPREGSQREGSQRESWNERRIRQAQQAIE